MMTSITNQADSITSNPPVDPATVTLSGYVLPERYGPESIETTEKDQPEKPSERIGQPGEFPYTRGIHQGMYRTRLWTMRQFAGFGSADDTNARFKYLLENAKGTNTGLSTAFDLPTLMGRDSDDALSAGEVGRCGVAIDTIEDMHRLYADIPVDQVTVSQTINGPACVIWAMYIAMAQQRDIDPAKLGGTLQNDILKEFHSQNEFIYPPEASVKLVVDTIEHAMNHLPRWNSVSISGYHIREAGSTATQELAFTLRDGMEYVHAAIERGLPVDSFAPRLSFFFNSHNEFFEEVCKLRAARRIWSTVMRDRYGAKSDRSLLMRTHVQTAGCSLTEQQPLNNIVRVAYQAMAGVLGGCQSLHTDSMDETLGLPTEQAVRVALRTQQILAYETGVTRTVDPLAGSWFVEGLTDEMESGANDIISEIDDMGGVVDGIHKGYFRRSIAEASYRFGQEMEAGDRLIVGVNAFNEGNNEQQVEILQIDHDVETKQCDRLTDFKRKRNDDAVKKSLDTIREAARDDINIMPSLIEASLANCTLGEMVQAMADVYGRYTGGPEW
ncbi:MAG: methylmalonyl-CoA mutase family protein [Phycisphaerales bacterium]|nr:methylmalonyl-CoA mutase family protein [Phycisphaerales bacterium]|tara:strand:- start:582 stop:2249 length:1668 start_codon:yes stop_codon:yes gene_type:complete